MSLAFSQRAATVLNYLPAQEAGQLLCRLSELARAAVAGDPEPVDPHARLTLARFVDALQSDVTHDCWRRLAQVDVERLANTLQGESRQTLAIVLLQLPPIVSAEILPLLAPLVQHDVVLCMIRSRRVSSAILSEIASSLLRQLDVPIGTGVSTTEAAA